MRHVEAKRERTVLLAAHARAGRSAVLAYFSTTVFRAVRVPLLIALASNLLALAMFWWASGEVMVSVAVGAHNFVDIVHKGYLGPLMAFFTSFKLSNAFGRYSKGLEIVQQLSVQLRAGANEALAALAQDGRDMQDCARAHEIVAWVKVYYIQACRGLNSVTLRGEQHRLQQRVMNQWGTFLDSRVQLSPEASAAVHVHSDIFVSTLQMELLWWRFLDPLLHWSQSGAKAGSFAEARRCFATARQSFHSAHNLASGIQATLVTQTLMRAVFYVCVCAIPWACVQKLGVFSLFPTLFTTFIFFGAQQLGADLWQPYGAEGFGVVSVELFARAEALCEQLDNMLSLFDDGHFAPLDMSAGPHFSLILSEGA